MRGPSAARSRRRVRVGEQLCGAPSGAHATRSRAAVLEGTGSSSRTDDRRLLLHVVCPSAMPRSLMDLNGVPSVRLAKWWRQYIIYKNYAVNFFTKLDNSCWIFMRVVLFLASIFMRTYGSVLLGRIFAHQSSARIVRPSSSSIFIWE